MAIGLIPQLPKACTLSCGKKDFVCRLVFVVGTVIQAAGWTIVYSALGQAGCWVLRNFLISVREGTGY